MSLKDIEPCLFCAIDPNRIVYQTEFAYAVYDAFPVTNLHALVIPKRHAETYFDLTENERADCHRLILILKNQIELQDDLVTGFNIGVNCGESAGQEIFHCHIHLLPRRKGDFYNSLGGVRGVLPR